MYLKSLRVTHPLHRHRVLVAAACIASPTLPALAQTSQGGGVAALWSRNCTMCHTETGAGGGAGTRTLLDDKLFDQSYDRVFFDTIKNGRRNTGMMPFGGALSDQQVWALVVHIRELQSKARRDRTGSSKATDGVYTTKLEKFRIEPVIEQGLDVPWAVDFLPDGRMLVTERPGRLRIHSTGKPGGTLSDPVEGTPTVWNKGQGGLLDVAVDPRYGERPESQWVYLAYSDLLERDGESLGMTKLVRGRIADGRWTGEQLLFSAKPEHYHPTDHHFGCRIVFDPADASLMYFSVGERGFADLAQNPSRPNGKIFRIHTDGSIPSDNPYADRDASSAYRAVWSVGHRNPQGLAFDLEGRLWETEHGPRGGDEFNLIQKGRNYGWPTVSFGINYDDTPLVTPWPGDRDIAMPADRWLPSIGACGLDVSRGETFARWKGDMLAGGLSGQSVDRIRLRDGKVVEREEVLQGLGRVRDVASGPDGGVYVVFNEPDRVVRLVPAGEK